LPEPGVIQARFGIPLHPCKTIVGGHRACRAWLHLAERLIVTRASRVPSCVGTAPRRIEVIGVQESPRREAAAGLLRDALVAEEDVVGPGAALLFGDDHRPAVEVIRGHAVDGSLHGAALWNVNRF